MAATQTLRMESNQIKTDSEIPRIDLAKIDNIPYYIESKLLKINKNNSWNHYFTYSLKEEYIRQIDEDYTYEEVPVEDYYENGKWN